MWSRSSRTSSKEKKQFSSAQEAYDCALNLLSYRDYSEKKMLERLQQKGADAEQSQQALEKLQHYGLVDDERYAARVYEGWLAKRCYGRQHLKAELTKRGVGAELIAELMERFTPELEAEHAANAAELFVQRNRKKLAGTQALEKKLYAAAGRFMAARGFGSGYMRVLLDRLHRESCSQV